MTDPTTPALDIDIDLVVFGGGIAGLWLANRFHHAGYRCVLIEARTLGGGQTLHSQGILHGGLKYALGGTLSSESEAIAGMPDRWRRLLQGQGEVDLRGVDVLSDTQYLWSAGSVASRFTTFFASRMLRGRIRKERPADYPVPLRNAAFRGSVYRLDDLVIDTPSLIRVLQRPIADRCLQARVQPEQLDWSTEGIEAIRLPGLTLRPRRAILAAGAGNAALLEQAQAHGLLRQSEVQLRPLHMVMVEQDQPLPFYGHCIGASNKPRLTVTTHRTDDGRWVWYLGGDLAEQGVQQSAAELEQTARRELQALMPWLDLSGARIHTTRIDRAEPRQQALVKPDNAVAESDGRLILAWPTKLTLAPDLGDRVAALLTDLPASGTHLSLPDTLARAMPGSSPWESHDHE